LKASIVSLPEYAKQANRLLTEQERTAMEDHIALFPEAHPVVVGTGGVRKARWRRAGHGKSGGVRTIYYFQRNRNSVYMLAVYAKSEKENLTPVEKNALKASVERIEKL
jgi:mRNA-degrading endonuclease RelE of RelBE toxin-antitoxin system